jgi:hypothetical protein
MDILAPPAKISENYRTLFCRWCHVTYGSLLRFQNDSKTCCKVGLKKRIEGAMVHVNIQRLTRELRSSSNRGHWVAQLFERYIEIGVLYRAS